MLGQIIDEDQSRESTQCNESAGSESDIGDDWFDGHENVVGNFTKTFKVRLQKFFQDIQFS